MYRAPHLGDPSPSHVQRQFPERRRVRECLHHPRSTYFPWGSDLVVRVAADNDVDAWHTLGEQAVDQGALMRNDDDDVGALAQQGNVATSGLDPARELELARVVLVAGLVGVVVCQCEQSDAHTAARDDPRRIAEEGLAGRRQRPGPASRTVSDKCIGGPHWKADESL